MIIGGKAGDTGGNEQGCEVKKTTEVYIERGLGCRVIGLCCGYYSDIDVCLSLCAPCRMASEIMLLIRCLILLEVVVKNTETQILKSADLWNQATGLETTTKRYVTVVTPGKRNAMIDRLPHAAVKHTLPFNVFRVGKG